MMRNAYRTIEPEEADSIWGELEFMAQALHKQLSRLCAAIQVFENGPAEVCVHNCSAGMKIAPKNGHGEIEAYLVPLVYADATALLKVEHETKTIRFLKIYPQLRRREDDQNQWNEIEALAQAAIEIHRAA